ncbi:glycoside hydrolase family 113 [Clostridium tetani]|uniref:Hydrolase n=1 Tax=Clostridium tetani TaxID=1513 RepID=A0ABY0EMQ8_CLOTA|nr:hypothetical protein [Clostridium tetani]KHO39793.1 hydrolase [Clostridium tetani]RXI54215.1 hydrolase [Clostridium tetani]RXI68877.1 hydrolase [Clostridium tetani]CDI48893.1 TIM-barrel fold family protein [Clostridium tetani 12124569]
MVKKYANISVALILIFILLYIPKWPSYIKEQISFKNIVSKFNREKFLEEKIKSANLSMDYNIDMVMKDVDRLNLNTVNVPVMVEIKSLTSTDMRINEESKKKARKLIKKLKENNIMVILEAYPWIKDGELYETNWKPDDINEFFWKWKTEILNELIEDIANPLKVEVLNVASNFVNMEYAEGYWCETIDYVKERFNGLITYRTNWWYTADWDYKTQESYNKKLDNQLFSKVDFISIAAYFELTDNDTNEVRNLVKALNSTERHNRNQNVKEELKTFHNKWSKPIFFGELGFPKRNKASIKPWYVNVSNIENGQEQANCFEAYRQVFEKETWLLGFSVFAIGENGKDKVYYPSRETIKIICKWYEKKK